MSESEGQTTPGWSKVSAWPTARFCIVYTAPILLSLVFAAGTDLPVRCAYVALVMAVYWATEALPLAVTSLIPIAAFPLLGIDATKVIVGKYMSNVVMMFLGGLIVAVAVEASNLHKRIALLIIRFIGTAPNRIMISFMIATALLSMWISNAAATAMMIPIVEGVIDSLARSADPTSSQHVDDTFSALLLLSVAYSANIGGIGVVTGTPPNLIAFKRLEKEITFPNWMAIACPLMLINLFACWAYLRLVIWISGRGKNKVSSDAAGLGNPNDKSQQDQLPLAESPTKKPKKEEENVQQEQVEDIKTFVDRSYKELGSFSYKETVISLLFVLLVALWFFQSPKFIAGWADLISPEEWKNSGKGIGAATPAILVVLLVFVIPACNPLPSLKRGEPAQYLMTWDLVQKKIPWGIILLLGGGLALSHGVSQSGLDKLIVEQVKSIQNSVSLTGLNFLVCFCTSLVTEVVSNTATSNIVIPMLVEISKALCKNPTYLVMSAVITCSNAFMLPVATAPNALVFSAMKGKLSTAKMMAIGGPLNIISLCITITIMEIWGNAVWLNAFPEWAMDETTDACRSFLANATLAAQT